MAHSSLNEWDEYWKQVGDGTIVLSSPALQTLVAHIRHKLTRLICCESTQADASVLLDNESTSDVSQQLPHSSDGAWARRTTRRACVFASGREDHLQAVGQVRTGTATGDVAVPQLEVARHAGGDGIRACIQRSLRVVDTARVGACGTYRCGPTDARGRARDTAEAVDERHLRLARATVRQHRRVGRQATARQREVIKCVDSVTLRTDLRAGARRVGCRNAVRREAERRSAERAVCVQVLRVDVAACAALVIPAKAHHAARIQGVLEIVLGRGRVGDNGRCAGPQGRAVGIETPCED